MTREQRIEASEAGNRFAELLDRVQTHRVVVMQQGQEKACLISARELRALEETLAVLEQEQLVRDLKAGLDDVRTGRIRPARKVFIELDAEIDGAD